MKKIVYAASAFLFFAGSAAIAQSSTMSKVKSTERTSVSGAGNVGIGTTDPKSKLHVLGDGATSGIATSYVTGIAITGNGGGGPGAGYPGSGIYFENVGLLAGSKLFKLNYTSNLTEAILNFQSVSDDAGTSVGAPFTVTRSGKIGVKNIDPVNNLSVNGNSSIGADYTSTSAPVNGAIIQGRVGIGTTAPAYKLDVIGDINAWGSVRASGVALTSDARLKRNIKSASYGLGAIMALRPVEYQKKISIGSNDYNRSEIGFIAQEVAKVIPSLVTEGTDPNKTLAVSYIELIPVLTKAIQDQQARIEALENLNAGFRAELTKVARLRDELNSTKVNIEKLAGNGGMEKPLAK